MGRITKKQRFPLIAAIIISISVGVFAANFEVKLPDTNGTSAFQVQDSSSTVLMEVESDGDVGIGTTTPSTKLEVNGTVTATGFATSSVSTTELGYLDGVTSAIQTQLNAKHATITGSATTIDTESLTASRALISNASQKVAVSSVTDTELGYVSGVTSAIQTQIDTKAATASPSLTGTVVLGDGTGTVTVNSSDWDISATGAMSGIGTIAADGDTTLNKADPSIIFDVSTATDTDFWMGVQDDGGGDDDDTFQIGDGTTPGTNPFLSISTSGNVGIGTTVPTRTLDVAGSGRFEGTATTALTGTIDPDGTTTVTGSGTKFLSELAVGDIITVTGETRTITAIASDTSLTVSENFSDNGDDASPDKVASGLLVLGGIRAAGGTPGSMGVNNVGYAFTGSGDNDSGMYSNTDGVLMFYTNDELRLQLSAANGNANVSFDGDGNWDWSSDVRLKTGIEDAENFLEKVMALQVRRYNFKKGDNRDFKEIGFIAQEVEPYFPELVGTRYHPDVGDDSKTLGYTTFGVIAIQALQELKVEKDEEMQELGKKLAEVQEDNERLKKRLDSLEKLEAQNSAFRKEIKEVRSLINILAGNASLSGSGNNIYANNRHIKENIR